MAPTLFDTDPKPGDLIEIDRGKYNHWAVFIGENEVVHLIPPIDSSSDLGGLGELFTLLDCNHSRVRRQKIQEVVRSSKFWVNNMLDDKYQPREAADIVRDACLMVGKELQYHVVTHNCEHFVTELRYGKPQSRQVQTAAVIGGAAIAGVAVGVLGAALFSALFKDNNKRRHDN